MTKNADALNQRLLQAQITERTLFGTLRNPMAYCLVLTGQIRAMMMITTMATPSPMPMQAIRNIELERSALSTSKAIRK